MSKKAILNLKLTNELSVSSSHKVDSDTSLAANSDKLIATQKAIKAYIDGATGTGDVTGPATNTADFLPQ